MQSAMDIESINPWPYLDPFFEYSSRNGNSLKYICQLCKPKCTEISSYINSPSNLGKHVKTVHGQMHYEEYQTLTSRARKRKGMNPGTSGASKQRKVINHESADVILQSSIDYHLISFLIHSHLPFQLVEQPEFKQLINALQPNVGIVSRSTLKQRMDQISEVMRVNIMSAMSTVDYIATTTLCWYSRQRRYIGVTAHWINSTSLQRCSATLACRTLNGSHNYNVLMNTIDEIHTTYNIADKIICTTTGSEHSLLQENTFNPSDIDNCGTREHIFPWELVDNDTQLADTFELLASGSNTNYRLPVYQRCACQILHLIIAKDGIEAEANDESFKSLHLGAFTKLSMLWNKLDRSTTNVESMDTVCGMQLKRPNQTKWNSIFYAVEGITLIIGRQGEAALRTIFNFLDVRTMTSTEQKFILDYYTVMKPVAKAIEMLQSEKNAYMGWLLPTLQELLNKLETAQTSSVYCKSLASAIIDGIQNRFGMMMVDPLLIGAAILHPKFKTDWTSDNAVIQAGLMYLSQKLEATANSTLETSKQEEEDSFFTSMNSRNQSSTTNKPSELASYLATESRDINMLHSFPTIKNLFILLNTSMPTSASCERLLSSEDLLFTSRHANIGSRDFENQLLMKMNWKHCG